MTASISLPARTSGRISADRVAGFGPLFRKELREWAHNKRPWVIAAVTTMFMTLTAANAAITSWIIANVPGGEVPAGPISLDPMTNFLAAVSSQIFVVVAILLQLLLPAPMVPQGRYLLPMLELALLVALVVANPFRMNRESAALRVAGLGLTALVGLSNGWSALLLAARIRSTSAAVAAAVRDGLVCGRRERSPRPSLLATRCRSSHL